MYALLQILAGLMEERYAVKETGRRGGGALRRLWQMRKVLSEKSIGDVT